MVVYTFVCLAQNQVASLVDIQELPDEAYRKHALRLLREHASAAAVEIWREDDVLEIIDRSGEAIAVQGRPDQADLSTRPATRSIAVDARAKRPEPLRESP